MSNYNDDATNPGWSMNGTEWNAMATVIDAKIENISEDTTPQLGGELDCNNNNITLGDNQKIYFNDAKTAYVMFNSATGDIEFYVNSTLVFVVSDD
jgi:hypothetical protein